MKIHAVHYPDNETASDVHAYIPCAHMQLIYKAVRHIHMHTEIGLHAAIAVQQLYTVSGCLKKVYHPTDNNLARSANLPTGIFCLH